MKKSRIYSFLFIVLSILFVSCASYKPTAPAVKPTLILVSFDGCRYDYPDKAKTPSLDKIAASGVKAKGLKTSFPSKTFPNHLTIVTGLYPEHHGIIANRIYDATTDTFYTLRNGAAREGKWYYGEPVWVTAERQGIKTATLFWPGSEAQINGYRPTYYKKYQHNLPFEQRVQQVLTWLDLPDDKRPQFITLYFHEPDAAGHTFGPASPEALAALENVDNQLLTLLKGIRSRHLKNKVNIMVVSDHGMASLSRDKVIFLDDYIDMNDVTIIDNAPLTSILPKQGKAAKVYRQLKDVHPHMQVYHKGELPEKYHYNDYKFIQPINAIADLHWSITTHEHFDTHPDFPSKGTHGFDPDYQEMNAIFYATGPAFKKGMELPVIQNTNLYELMCAVLKIEPAANDGSLEVTKAALKE